MAGGRRASAVRMLRQVLPACLDRHTTSHATEPARAGCNLEDLPEAALVLIASGLPNRQRKAFSGACGSLHTAVLATQPRAKVPAAELAAFLERRHKMPVIHRITVFTGGRGTGPHLHRLCAGTLQQLALFPALRELRLQVSSYQPGPSPEQQLPCVIAALSRLPNLAVLSLDGMPDLRPASIVALASLELPALALAVGPGGLQAAHDCPHAQQLAALTSLTSLKVPCGSWYMRNGGAAAIGQLTALIELDVNDCGLRPRELGPLTPHLSQLIRLVVYRNAEVHASGMRMIARLPRLRSLDAHDCNLGDDAVAQLVARTALKFLDISNLGSQGCKPRHIRIATVSKLGARNIAHTLPNLVCLRINGNPLGAEGISVFSVLEHLTELSVRSCLGASNSPTPVAHAGASKPAIAAVREAMVRSRVRTQPFKLDVS